MAHRRIRLVLVALAVLAVGACGSESEESSGSGEPGNPADADRMVDVRILPTKRYEPCSIGVASGETVTFKVTNTAAEIKEFVIGDEKVQDEYEKEMAGMGSTPMKMADRSYTLNIDPGQTEEITWTFPTEEGATVIYGSHEPGDYAAGLKGTVTVGEAAACVTPASSPATTAAGTATTAAGTTAAGTATTAAGTATTTTPGRSPTTMDPNMPGMPGMPGSSGG